MVCHGRDPWSVLDPTSSLLQDAKKTKSTHKAVDCSCVILVTPGSVHNSTLAEWGGMYQLLHSTYRRNKGKCIMDSAFAAGHKIIIKSSQDFTSAKNANELIHFQEAMAMHQAAKWGMHALKGSFPHLEEHIQYEKNND